jgi:exodeoxyribonuclease V alpha subunit
MTASTRGNEADFSGISTPGLVARTRSFVDEGILALEDVYVVDRLVDLVRRRGSGVGAEAEARSADPDVLLALCLAVRAPREGSAGVDLQAIGERLHSRGLDIPEATSWTARVLETTTLVATSCADTRPFVHDGALLAMRRYAVHQADLAATLLQKRAAPAVVLTPRSSTACAEAICRAFGVAPAEEVNPLGDQQRRAVETALSSGLLLLCGGPGTGKTYTLRRLIVVLRALFRAETGRDPQIALAAPTGKAAVRMGDLVHVNTAPPQAGDQDQAAGAEADEPAEELRFLRSLRPSTIHRLLGLGGGPAPRPRATRARPLPHDVVIVDEASMIDLAMMDRLTAAVRPDARLILVGDPQQLASVEAGSVLADVISPEATALAPAVVRLTRSHRVALDSPLALLGQCLAEGSPQSLEHAVRLFRPGPVPALSNYPHTDSSVSREAEAIAANHHRELVDLVTQTTGSPEAIAHDALRRLADFRLLTPHRVGRLGVLGLTATLVARLARERPAHVRVDTRAPFFPGMPLMVLENRPDLGLVNGDVGVVTRDDSKRLVVAFGAVGGEGPPRFFRRAELPAYEPCLAMTVHKSQGSQYRSVLLVLPNEPSPIVTRELLYTAVTRAEQSVVLAGSTAVFRRALDRRITRASSLALPLGRPRR